MHSLCKNVRRAKSFCLHFKYLMEISDYKYKSMHSFSLSFLKFNQKYTKQNQNYKSIK